MSKTTRHPEVTVKRIHFEDFSGPEFERLCFAYLLRAFEWNAIDWYGQLGGDAGRDIWAVRTTGEAECFQCANHRALKFKKAEEDMAKLVAAPNAPGVRPAWSAVPLTRGIGAQRPGRRPWQSLGNCPQVSL